MLALDILLVIAVALGIVAQAYEASLPQRPSEYTLESLGLEEPAQGV